ncbi:MAG: hypothetical protein IIV41_04415, partial [Akkermansia sp.]|nr:hypothetical protein [Akkermansia sp.]
MRHILPLLVLLCLLTVTACSQMPGDCRQAIIGVSDGWDSSHVTLTLVEKNAAGKWQRVLGPVPGRLGRNGSVWGLGVHSNPGGATTKREGDGRSPAGIYELGGLWVTNP